MIKVNSFNYNNGYTGLKKTQGRKSNPNFTGSVAKPVNFANYLKQTKLIKFMQKLKWFDGEQGRILITAIGTGAIAPLFIAWNPYVKPKEGATQEEKDNLKKTQKYTAMRQPISAALAIPIQMSLVKPIEKGLDVIFNNPHYSKKLPIYMDKSALQDDKYIERQEKAKLKGQNLNKEERKAKLSENVKKVKEEQISKVANDFLQTGEIRIREGADGIVDNKSTAEALKNEIRGYMSDANFLRYDSLDNNELEKLLANPDVELQEITKGKDFYAQRAETLVNNQTELRKVLGSELPKENAEITEYLKRHISNTEDEKLKEVYQEIIDLPDPDSQASRCSRTIERIDKIERICGGRNSFTKEKYLQYMTEDEAELTRRLRKFAEVYKSLDETPEGIKKAISELAENCRFDTNNSKLNTIFHDISTFGENSSTLKEKICKDIVKGYKSMLSKRYRFMKEVAGISLGMFVTVPITCHALNWVYPRFMELFLPNLASSKAPKATNAQTATNVQNATNKSGGEK